MNFHDPRPVSTHFHMCIRGQRSSCILSLVWIIFLKRVYKHDMRLFSYFLLLKLIGKYPFLTLCLVHNEFLLQFISRNRRTKYECATEL